MSIIAETESKSWENGAWPLRIIRRVKPKRLSCLFIVVITFVGIKVLWLQLVASAVVRNYMYKANKRRRDVRYSNNGLAPSRSKFVLAFAQPGLKYRVQASCEDVLNRSMLGIDLMMERRKLTVKTIEKRRFRNDACSG